MPRVNVAYMAGFFDGEGHISIAKRASGTGSLTVQVCNTNAEVLEGFRSVYGGAVNDVTRNHKPTWKWTVCSSAASDFLRDVLPYLIVKREQAEIAIRFQDLLRPKGGAPLTDDEIAQRVSIRDELLAARR
jgi:hypothetical protein